jgi:large conductance mechanosensitive channel
MPVRTNELIFILIYMAIQVKNPSLQKILEVGENDVVKGFRDFILRGNVIDLAVAVIIGSAFNTVVVALVKDIITPFIGIFGGKATFSEIYFTVNKSRFMVGDLINSVVSFIIEAAVVYFFIVLPMNQIMSRMKKGEKVDPEEKTCPECLSMIPINAKRCKYCTAVIK